MCNMQQKNFVALLLSFFIFILFDGFFDFIKKVLKEFFLLNNCYFISNNEKFNV